MGEVPTGAFPVGRLDLGGTLARWLKFEVGADQVFLAYSLQGNLGGMAGVELSMSWLGYGARHTWGVLVGCVEPKWGMREVPRCCTQEVLWLVIWS